MSFEIANAVPSFAGSNLSRGLSPVTTTRKSWFNFNSMGHCAEAGFAQTHTAVESNPIVKMAKISQCYSSKT